MKLRNFIRSNEKEDHELAMLQYREDKNLKMYFAYKRVKFEIDISISLVGIRRNLKLKSLTKTKALNQMNLWRLVGWIQIWDGNLISCKD